MLDRNITIEVEHGTNNETHAYLSYHLELPSESCLILTEDLDVIIHETDGPQPYRGDEKSDDVDVIQLSKKQSRYQNAGKNDETSHCRCSLLLHLSF